VTTARRAHGQSYRLIEQNQRMSTPGQAAREQLPDGPGMAVLVVRMPGGVRPPTDHTAAMIACSK
jgi:hypothetical protein